MATPFIPLGTPVAWEALITVDNGPYRETITGTVFGVQWGSLNEDPVVVGYIVVPTRPRPWGYCEESDYLPPHRVWAIEPAAGANA